MSVITDAASWLSDGGNWTGDGGVPNRVVEHLGYTGLTLAVAAAVAVPMGLYIGHTGRLRSTAIGVTGALRALLPWPEASRLDELAPERVEVPSGSTVRIDYSQEQPVLAVRLQEVFGWSTAPALADGRVPVLLHLLSPARVDAFLSA